MVIKNDPTLMFTNAGMNQFKPYFLGNAEPEHPRVADTQKCLRVSGKHNDLEEVGADHYHHTMFEMLGNWSFGDYFKKEAIDWAWELLVEKYGLEKELLYVTVFEGDEKENVPFDQEAFDCWKKYLPEERILRGNKKDNFWEMGDIGPCGPCSEIHVDLRSPEERKNTDGASLVNTSHPEVIEVWNLVFIQFNRLENQSLQLLPNKHVDTGMGFERLVRALQGKKSNYDTDVFLPLIEAIEKQSGAKYGGTDSRADIAFRVIADHIRAVAFSIADGQLPSNTGAGYVIRRILRRAIRYAYSGLGIEQPFLAGVSEVLVSEMASFFPELSRNSGLIKNVLTEEERAFLGTLSNGIKRLEGYIAQGKAKTIEGEVAFELYDTFGFPIDLTELIAREHGLQVDMAGFQTELAKQKDRSRNASKVSSSDWVEVHPGLSSVFVGYDLSETDTRVVRYRKVHAKNKEQFQVVLETTPFYAESGGQVGDTGKLVFGNEEVHVVDTKRENDVTMHLVNGLPEDIEGPVKAKIDKQRREEIKKNHTATHLMHLALRNRLGKHVEQKGSLVAPDRLRFDFSHFQKVDEAELKDIENSVLLQMAEAHELVEMRSVPIREAREMGAMALFGEKYGDKVRVIKFGASIELCGGTHVGNTSQLGGFKILSEGSVASGIRRIEAISGKAYEEYINQRLSLLVQMEDALGNVKDPLAKLLAVMEERESLGKKLGELEEREKRDKIKALQARLAQQESSPVAVLVQKLEPGDAKSIKDIAFQVSSVNGQSVIVLGCEEGGKATVVVAIGKELATAGALNASEIIKKIAPMIDGGGGGQSFLAMAGGKNPSGLDKALEVAGNLVREKLS